MFRALLVVLALAILPLAGAEWRGAGGLEPDTRRDVDDGLMFPGPPTATGTRVYFQAFTAAPETSVNPNVGLVGTRLLPAPALHHRAILGVWTDCNRDGYIGLAESAVTDYSTLLLSDASLCPNVVGATSPVHNAAGWVSELLAIGMVDPCEYAREASVRETCGVDAWAPNERVFYANGTYVWGDLGAPGSIPETECILAPLPSGTTTSTGAVVAWSDCQSRRGIAHAVNDVDGIFGGGLGLGFDDPSRPQDSDSVLNQRFPVTPFGDGASPGLLQDDTDQPSMTVWDCAEPATLEVNDPDGRREVALTDPTGQLHAERFPLVIVHSLTGVGFVDEDRNPATPGVLRRSLTDEQGTYARIPSVDGEVHAVSASWWLALVNAADGPAGDCDTSTPSPLAAAYPGRMIESDASPILEARKDRASLTFTFYDGHRGLHPSLDPYVGYTFPSDGGTMVLDHGGPPPEHRGGDGPLWSATAQSEQDAQLVDREDLQPKGAVYFTYYARLGDIAIFFDRPSDGARAYGEENCGSAQAGIVNGWVCDPSLWWRDAHGNDNTPRYAQGDRIGRIPGDEYHLRDVDCFDGEIARGAGVYASLVYLVDQGACV